jgi:hypothetical protein
MGIVALPYVYIYLNPVQPMVSKTRSLASSSCDDCLDSQFLIMKLPISVYSLLLGLASALVKSPQDAQERSVQPSPDSLFAQAWPYGPFRTKGRNIVNSRGEVITWAGVNWPMSGT